MIICLEKYANEYYGVGSKIQLKSLADMQNSTVTVYECQNALCAAKITELIADKIGDSDLAKELVDNINERMGEYILIKDADNKYLLIWFGDLILKVSVPGVEDIVIKNMEYFLMEFIIV